ncbi:MAG: hypothetical protein HRF49_05450 [bacterium]|jgi:transposase
MCRFLRYAAFAAVMILAFSISGCAKPEEKLKSRAAEYYNYLTGASDTIGGEFASPALNASMDDQTRKLKQKALEELRKARLENMKKSGKTATTVAKEQVQVAVENNFAITTLPDVMEPPIVRQAVRWVYDGGQWYIYSGDRSEVEKYGQFPDSLVTKSLNPGAALGSGELRERLKENVKERVDEAKEKIEERREGKAGGDSGKEEGA